MTLYSDIAKSLKITTEEEYRAYVQGAAEAMAEALRSRGITLESVRATEQAARQQEQADADQRRANEQQSFLRKIAKAKPSDQHAKLWAEYERLSAIAERLSPNPHDPKADKEAWSRVDRIACDAMSDACAALDRVCETPAATIEGLSHQLRAMRICWQGEHQEERIVAVISRTVELIQASAKQSSPARRTKRS